jgi:hypothetical protein
VLAAGSGSVQLALTLSHALALLLVQAYLVLPDIVEHGW